jgi:predicted DNA-binding protein
MRTTLTLDEQVAKALKDAAHRTGKPFKHVVNEALRAGLAGGRAAVKARPYRVKPASLGGVLGGVDLHRALRLADELEDREIARKLALRK